MSTVMSYSAVRFRFNKEFSSTHEMYEFIKTYLGEPNRVAYKLEWSEVKKKFIVTNEIEHFSYLERKGEYVVLQSYETGDWYLDYMLEDSVESNDDLNISISLSKLKDIERSTRERFVGCLEEGCKLKIFEWYTGCDMLVNY